MQAHRPTARRATWLRTIEIAALMVVVGFGAPISGQVLRARTETSLLARVARYGYLQFSVQSGRISVYPTRSNLSTSSSTSSNSSKQKLTIRTTDGKPSLTFESTTPEEEFSIAVEDTQQVRFARKGRGDESTLVPVEFVQQPGAPITLTLGSGDDKRVYRAKTIWHLLIGYPELCAEHVIPVLRQLRPDWDLAAEAGALEEELLRIAVDNELPDVKLWSSLVDQLADERFAKREAADRQLRAAGDAVLDFLLQIDFRRLDAEQQYRLRRIIKSMTEAVAGDAPEKLAPRMVSGAEIWLALLSRKEESTRRIAVQRLTTILGRPIPIDPAADPVTQQDQINHLRAQILE